MAVQSEKPITPIVELGRLPAVPPEAIARRTARTRQMVLIVGAVWLAGLIGFLVWPVDLLQKLIWLNSGLCPQRPAHSYFFEGQQMPIEARMVGIFGGYLLTIFGLWLVGRGRAMLLPRLPLLLALVGLVAVMAFDGLNSTFLDLGWFHLYQPQNWLRVLTGAISGVGMAGLILPIFSQVIWRRAYLIAPFRHAWELGVALLVVGLVVLGTISGWGWLFWPLSLLAAGGVLTMLVMFNWIIGLTMLNRWNRLEGGAGLLLSLLLVSLATLGEMMLLAGLRMATIGAGFAV